MKFITNIRDPRTNEMGYIIPGREEMPERYPIEWIRETFSDFNEDDLKIVIERDGNCIIGEPRASKKYTAEQLKSMGLIGLYRD